LDTFWHIWCQGGHAGHSPGSFGAAGCQVVPFVDIFGHLFVYLLTPLVSRWSPMAHPRRPPEQLWQHFCGPLVQKRHQRMSKVRICGFYENVCFLVVKRYILGGWAARGAPNGHFLIPFWYLLGHFGAPDPPVAAPRAPLGHICGPARIFAAFWLPKGTPANP